MSLMGYLDDTPPSFYDLDAPWACTIGKYEYEQEAWFITQYCQEHGDRWQAVPAACLPVRTQGRVEVRMEERWLAMLQRVRVRLEGPPELIRNSKAWHGLQLKYPHGMIIAACHQFSDAEMVALSELLNNNEKAGEAEEKG